MYQDYLSWYKVPLKEGDNTVAKVVKRFMRGGNPYNISARTLRQTCVIDDEFAYFKFENAGKIYEMLD